MRAGGSYTNNKAPFLTPFTPTPTCSQSKAKDRIPINSPSWPALRLSTFPVSGPRLSSGRIALAAAEARAGVCCEIRSVNGASEMASAWDNKPLEIPRNGKKPYFYLDEMDILTFLDPPNHLIPLDPTSYNPAAYLWKKIGDIPEERRHRLLQLLNPRLISKAWEIAGARYHDPKFLKESASNFLSNKDGEIPPQVYSCRTSGGASFVAQFANRLSPLYFEVTQLKEVMPTEQPCDLSYEFGDGLLDLHEYPAGFPKPVKHPYPFSDQVVIYIRLIGPGVLVGQAWQEGKKLDQVPKKLCREILMVKEYAASGENH
ncbi:uncharacterized protein LOC111278842 isoform X2 [Durio zibethinus]|uniref:Uncharacterized protein LOC111278842 isoform X2 n=1 Tax=Durio zibethinus TaxID=66656 RepID=A0A6P5WYR6_DURZI|nr:uncharacterized protein LOC111278842 isoform X2 [Durio zibethinus]